MRPTPTEMRPNTGADPEQVSQIEPPLEDGPTPSTKTDPLTPPGTEVPGGRADRSRETNAPSNATAEIAFEGDCVELASPSKSCVPKPPAKVERGERT